jgi:hypothetical protein
MSSERSVRDLSGLYRNGLAEEEGFDLAWHEGWDLLGHVGALQPRY